MECFDEYEQVPDELSQQINELIKNELNNRLGSEINELNRLRKSDKELRSRIYDLKREIQKLSTTNEKELKKMLEDKEKETLRKHFGGFTCGDEVYYVYGKREESHCQSCNGTGKVKVVVDEKEININCPFCSYGKIVKYISVPKKVRISQTDCKSWNENKCTEIQFSFWIRDERDDGREVRPTEVFATLEECQAECDRRNNKQI